MTYQYGQDPGVAYEDRALPAIVYVLYILGLFHGLTLIIGLIMALVGPRVLNYLAESKVKAARIHTSVELTSETLRQGTETIKVAEIVRVYPEPEHPSTSEKELERWQSARALGELVGVPKGRTGIGVRLTGGRTAQAWARRHRHLRAALTPLVEERVGPKAPAIESADDDGPDHPDAGSLT